MNDADRDMVDTRRFLAELTGHATGLGFMRMCTSRDDLLRVFEGVAFTLALVLYEPEYAAGLAQRILPATFAPETREAARELTRLMPLSREVDRESSLR